MIIFQWTLTPSPFNIVLDPYHRHRFKYHSPSPILTTIQSSLINTVSSAIVVSLFLGHFLQLHYTLHLVLYRYLLGFISVDCFPRSHIVCSELPQLSNAVGGATFLHSPMETALVS